MTHPIIAAGAQNKVFWDKTHIPGSTSPFVQLMPQSAIQRHELMARTPPQTSTDGAVPPRFAARYLFVVNRLTLWDHIAVIRRTTTKTVVLPFARPPLTTHHSLNFISFMVAPHGRERN
jgi:hypothetical protein